MLEIFKYISQGKNTVINAPKKEGNNKGITKHYAPASKEWSNSIYAYNKNYVKLLPVADNVIIKLITSYFNMYNKELINKIKIRPLSNRKIKLSSRKIWVSKAELKHTSDKVIINLFIYDRNSNFLILKMENILNTFIKDKMRNILKTLKVIKFHLYTNMWNYYINIYKQNSTQYIDTIKKENYNIVLILNNIKSNKIFKNIENTIKINSIKKILKKELFIMFYKQIILFNNLKVKNIYILPLTRLLSKIYNKKIIFNIVRLKYYFLNSDILTQIIVSKTKNRKNRNIKVLSTSIRNIETPKFNTKLIIREPTKLIGVQNYIIKNEFLTTYQEGKDKLSEVLNSFYLLDNSRRFVLNTLKYKTVSGIKLQAFGRLTKRFTAERSVFNYRYIGSTRDINSSYRGLSSTIIRGKLKSNTQFSKLASKTRIGAFGLKGWIGGI